MKNKIAFITLLVISISFNAYSETQKNNESDKLKNNMKTLQLMLEYYAVDNGGKYPENLDLLYKDATNNKNGTKPPYWTEIENPYTKKSGIGFDKALMPYNDFLNIRKKENIDCRGVVFYEFIQNNSDLTKTKYIIYNCNQNGIISNYVMTNTIP